MQLPRGPTENHGQFLLARRIGTERDLSATATTWTELEIEIEIEIENGRQELDYLQEDQSW